MSARIFKILLVGLFLLGKPMMGDDGISNLAAQYKKITTEQGKLMFCIKIIDDKVVTCGMSVGIIDQIFGTDFKTMLPSKEKGEITDVVYFGKLSPVVHPTIFDGGQRSFSGWKLNVTYNDEGIVTDYYLTNLSGK